MSETTDEVNATPNVKQRERRVSVRPDLALRLLEFAPTQTNQPNVSDPVFVLLHGLASNALMWAGVAEVLASRGYRALCVDQRGHGRSDKPNGPYDLATVTDDLLGLLDLEGLDRPIVAGQSWGANVVVEFAARFQGRARGIVPVDGGFIDLATSFPIWEDCEREMAPPRIAGTPATTVEGWMRSAHPDWSDAGINAMMGFVEVRADGSAHPWLTFENHIKVLRGLWEHHPMDRYPLITDPVWFVVANPKQMSKGWYALKESSVADAQSALAQVRTTWMDGDHDLHAQYPDAVADLLLRAHTEGFFA